MRAFAVGSFGEPASVHDLPVPTADAEVLIRVRFAGVNPLDNNALGRLTAASPYRRPGSTACATWSSSSRRADRRAGMIVIRPSRMKGRNRSGRSLNTGFMTMIMAARPAVPLP